MALRCETGRDVVGRVRGGGWQTAALVRLDGEQRSDLGERPRGVAIAKTQAANGAGESVQLSRGALGWRCEVADEDKVRRRAGGRAVQWTRNVAAQSARAADDNARRCTRTGGGPEKVIGKRRAVGQAGREIDLCGLHTDAGRDGRSDGGVQQSTPGV